MRCNRDKLQYNINMQAGIFNLFSMEGINKMGRTVGRPNIPTKLIILALQNADGLVSVAAKSLGCSIQVIYQRAKKNEKIKDMIETRRMSFVDDAEKGLAWALAHNEPWAIAFTLKTLGRDRGYAEKTEVANTGELTINVHHINRPVRSDTAS